MTDESVAMMPLPIVQSVLVDDQVAATITPADANSSSKKNSRSDNLTYNHSNQRNNRNNYNNGGGRFHNNHNYHYQMNGMYGNRGYPYHHAAYEIDPQMREYYNHMAVQQM